LYLHPVNEANVCSGGSLVHGYLDNAAHFAEAPLLPKFILKSIANVSNVRGRGNGKIEVVPRLLLFVPRVFSFIKQMLPADVAKILLVNVRGANRPLLVATLSRSEVAFYLFLPIWYVWLLGKCPLYC
jgi:hypothetical protein